MMISASSLLMMDDRVAIRPGEKEVASRGGIVLPETSREKPTRGTVVAVGPGRMLGDGMRGEMVLRPGDVVIYGRYIGDVDIKADGDDLKIMRETDILARIV